MLFVSYSFTSKSRFGFGNINIHLDGLHSTEDVRNVADAIKRICKKDTDEDIEVVVLNWRKYDPYP